MQYIQFLIEHWVLSAAFILVLVGIFWLEMKGKVGGTSRVTSSEAVLLINKQNAKVLDVREKGTFNAGHIVNSMHVTKDEIADGAQKLKKYQTQPVLLVCANGTHSSTLGAQLIKQGFGEIYFLQGGINAWKADNLPLVKD